LRPLRILDAGLRRGGIRGFRERRGAHAKRTFGKGAGGVDDGGAGARAQFGQGTAPMEVGVRLSEPDSNARDRNANLGQHGRGVLEMADMVVHSGPAILSLGCPTAY
jgi:hypothetical protein